MKIGSILINTFYNNMTYLTQTYKVKHSIIRRVFVKMMNYDSFRVATDLTRVTVSCDHFASKSSESSYMISFSTFLSVLTKTLLIPFSGKFKLLFSTFFTHPLSKKRSSAAVGAYSLSHPLTSIRHSRLFHRNILSTLIHEVKEAV